MFTATPEERKLVADILVHTNSEVSRTLSTETAINVFQSSGLCRDDLREIWRLADADRNGMITSKELAVALRLMGWVQAGEPLSDYLLELPGPLPTLEGISEVRRPNHVEPFPPTISSRSPSSSSASLASQQPVNSSRSAGSSSNQRNEANSTAPPASVTPTVAAPTLHLPSMSEPQSRLGRTHTRQGTLPTLIEGTPPTSLLEAAFLTSPRNEPRGRSRNDGLAERSTQQSPTQTRGSPPPYLDLPSPVQPQSQPERQRQTRRQPPPELPQLPPRPQPDSSQSTSPSSAQPSGSSSAQSTNEVEELKTQLQEQRRRNRDLAIQIQDLELAMSQVLAANEQGAAAQREIDDELAVMATRVVELERFENAYKEAAETLQKITRDLEDIKKLKEDQRKELRKIIDEQDETISSLKTTLSDAEASKASNERLSMENIQRLTAENLRLTQRLEDRERVFGREKEQLSSRVQELEVLVAELQWSETELNLQQGIESVTRENDVLKEKIQQIETTREAQLAAHEALVAEYQRQLAEVRRENARLAFTVVTGGGGGISLSGEPQPSNQPAVPAAASTARVQPPPPPPPGPSPSPGPLLRSSAQDEAPPPAYDVAISTPVEA